MHAGATAVSTSVAVYTPYSRKLGGGGQRLFPVGDTLGHLSASFSELYLRIEC